MGVFGEGFGAMGSGAEITNGGYKNYKLYDNNDNNDDNEEINIIGNIGDKIDIIKLSNDYGIKTANVFNLRSKYIQDYNDIIVNDGGIYIYVFNSDYNSFDDYKKLDAIYVFFSKLIGYYDYKLNGKDCRTFILSNEYEIKFKFDNKKTHYEVKTETGVKLFPSQRSDFVNNFMLPKVLKESNIPNISNVCGKETLDKVIAFYGDKLIYPDNKITEGLGSSLKTLLKKTGIIKDRTYHSTLNDKTEKKPVVSGYGDLRVNTLGRNSDKNKEKKIMNEINNAIIIKELEDLLNYSFNNITFKTFKQTRRLIDALAETGLIDMMRTKQYYYIFGYIYNLCKDLNIDLNRIEELISESLDNLEGNPTANDPKLKELYTSKDPENIKELLKAEFITDKFEQKLLQIFNQMLFILYKTLDKFRAIEGYNYKMKFINVKYSNKQMLEKYIEDIHRLNKDVLNIIPK